jgi:hypothetical protein
MYTRGQGFRCESRKSAASMQSRLTERIGHVKKTEVRFSKGRMIVENHVR